VADTGIVNEKYLFCTTSEEVRRNAAPMRCVESGSADQRKRYGILCIDRGSGVR
jgi:hypothetical protein